MAILHVFCTSLVSIIFYASLSVLGNTKINKTPKSLQSQRGIMICKSTVHLNTMGTKKFVVYRKDNREKILNPESNVKEEIRVDLGNVCFLNQVLKYENSLPGP